MLLLLLAGGSLFLRAESPSSKTTRDRAHAEVEEVEEAQPEVDSAEQVRERVLLYLQQHGDQGRIDPERRRERVAREYARFRDIENRNGRLGPLSIGGNEWRSLGPTNGAGRMTAIAFHPNDNNLVYAGAAGGGLWKTTDAGISWIPLTEGINDLAVGAVAVAPSNPSVIYLGTGEGGYAIDFISGIGLLKSTDGGATWILPSSVIAARFYKISVHPTNPFELVVASSRGALRSTDGGNTFTTVLTREAYGDIADLVRDPGSPGTLYATTWCVTGACTFKTSKVVKSTDGGVTWTDKSTGLPQSTTTGFDERMSIAISASNPQVLYAARAIKPTTGTIVSHMYKTTDGGTSWQELPVVMNSYSRYLADQSWYNNTIAVSPTDADTFVAGGTTYIRSSDGGVTFSSAFNSAGVHVDAHEIKYQGSTLWIANDGGVWTSPDNGRTATARNDGLVTRQFYALAIDPVNRDRMLAGAQDNGTSQRTDATSTWRAVLGGDGFECAIHPVTPGLAFGTIQHGVIRRTRNSALAAAPIFEDVSPPYDTGEATPFLSLVRLDPRSVGTVYTGSYRVWRSRDAGMVWLPLPTATTDGSTWPTSTALTTIAITPADPLLLLVANETGNVFRSGDAGQTWVSGTSGLPAARLNNLEIDPRDSSIVYAAIASTIEASVYKSTNGGLTWTPSAAGLPSFAAQVIRVDPTDSNVVFCGTDVGVYRSTDRGATWSKFGTGLPSTSVADLQVLDDGTLLRVATHGRGIWELLVTPNGNTPPVAAISTFGTGSVLHLARGESAVLAGSVSDADAGDHATGTWIFPDSLDPVPLGGAAGTVTHVFRHAGSFSVVLVARDTRGALSTSTLLVLVSEPADSCATPVVIPADGPFPYTVIVNSETATTQAGDPVPVCSPGSGSPASLWFEFTPTATSNYQFSTCGGGTDTVLSAYSGSGCGPYTPLASSCNDDVAPNTAGCGAQASVISVAGTAGQTIRVQATGFDAASIGTFPLTVRPIGGSNPVNAPRVTGVSASEGPSFGGTLVLVTGVGFQDGSTVTFGGVPATEVTLFGTTLLQVRTPAHNPGDVDVAVTVPSSPTATLVRGYTFTQFVIVPCVAGPTVLCLNGNRFKVEVAWRVPSQNSSGIGNGIALTADTGYFWFFSANNIELVLKVVDGRPVNGKFWVFYGALSNVEYTITVTDTETGSAKIYANPDGRLSSVADTSAF